MMRLIICSPIAEIAAEISIAADFSGIEADIEPSPQQFGSTLFRDPDAVGVFWSQGFAGAAETCRRLRLAEVRNILFAVLEDFGSHHDQAGGRAIVLNAGADDVQPWPVDPLEMIARLNALHRRTRDADVGMIPLPGAVFYPAGGMVVGDNASVHLTKQESALLEVLATRPGMLVTKAMCMLALYDGRDEPQMKIIDVFACRLRRKILSVTGGLDVIETVWGQGYRFCQAGFAPVLADTRRRTAG